MQFIHSIIHLSFIFKGQVPWPTLTFRSKANFFTISNALTIFARIVCWNFRSLFVFDSIFLAVAQSVAQRSLRSKQCRIHQNQDKYQKDLHVATQIIKLIFLVKQVFSTKMMNFYHFCSLIALRALRYKITLNGTISQKITQPLHNQA